MGKSGRAKSVIRNRNARREKVYGPVEAERVMRLAEKQRATSGKLPVQMDIETDSATADSTAASAAADDGMQIDQAPAKKVSLRKPKVNKRHNYKNQKTKKPKPANGKGRFRWVPQKR